MGKENLLTPYQLASNVDVIMPFLQNDMLKIVKIKGFWKS